MYLYEFLKEEYEKADIKFSLEEIKGKTFFITGSNGLIGSNLVNFLYFLSKKHSLGIKITAHSFSAPVPWLPKDGCIHYLSSDLAKGLPEQKFDFLIHTATYGQPKQFMKNQLATIKLNTETLVRLLENAKSNNAKVLFISSSEIYGQVPMDIMPVKETYFGNVDTLSERAVYAEAKRMAETICNVFSKNGLYVKVIRLGISYGPGVKYSDTRFMNEFIKRSLEEGQLTMRDAGRAIRCFCFISDIIEMMLNTFLMSKDIIYNLSGIDNKTVRQVAEMITSRLGIELHLPKEEEGIGGTPAQLQLDNSKYCNEFKKHDFISFEHGLNKTMEWIKLLKGNSKK